MYAPGGQDIGEWYDRGGEMPYDADGRFFVYCINDCPGGKNIYVKDDETLADMKENGMGLCPCCRREENEKLERLIQ